MEELKTQLEAHEAVWSEGNEAAGEMTKAAQKWASHCLATYVGDLLRKGLAVAATLAEFDSEFHQQDKKGVVSE